MLFDWPDSSKDEFDKPFKEYEAAKNEGFFTDELTNAKGYYSIDDSERALSHDYPSWYPPEQSNRLKIMANALYFRVKPNYFPFYGSYNYTPLEMNLD